MRLPVQRAMEVCPVEVAVSVLGGTWKLTLVKHLLEGTRRFNELGRLVPLANTRTLTRQLRELEEDGIVRRTVYREVPPKVEYSLTDLGRSLGGIVERMDRWGEHFAEDRAQMTARDEPAHAPARDEAR
ncbi:winged helix-turn-helix transcriptional regulator [Brachybacterium sp. GCM10030267]|uniref:winged helix-turn-helix transcriptional regulator n=1 Tax=unclassified Brachybacterium TaxID=2623841 RepID=UPI00360F795E